MWELKGKPHENTTCMCVPYVDNFTSVNEKCSKSPRGMYKIPFRRLIFNRFKVTIYLNLSMHVRDTHVVFSCGFPFSLDLIYNVAVYRHLNLRI